MSARHAVGAALLLLAAAWAATAPAATAPPTFTPGEVAAVKSVVDGGEIILVDGRVVRLVGIAPPRRASAGAPHRGRRLPPLPERAKAALERMIGDHPVELRYAGNPADRHGHVLAQLFVGKRWVQGELLRRGLARVESSADNRLGLALMLKREAQARRARRGLWRDPLYAVRRAEEAGQYRDSYQLVEGTVVDVGHADGQVFLNFAEDGRHGFTLRLAPETARLFRAEGIDVALFEGAQIRARGWIRGGERPTIDITHPEQIERLE